MIVNENIVLWVVGTIMQAISFSFFLYFMIKEKSSFGLICFLSSYVLSTQEFIPPFYSLISNRYPDWMVLLRDNSISFGVFLSGVYWLTFLIGICFFYKNKSDFVFTRLIVRIIPKNKFYPFLIFIGMVSFLGHFALDSEALSEGFGSAGAVITDRNVRTSIFSGLLGPFGALAMPCAAALLAVSLLGENKDLKTWIYIRYFTYLFLFLVIVFGFTMGARGQLLTVGIILCAIYWIFYDRKKVFNILLYVAIFGILSSPVILTYKAQKDLYLNLSFIDRIENIANIFFDSRSDFHILDSLERIIYRYDGVHNGGNLALYALETHYVHLIPYINTFYAVIPRFFWPEKPQPKSVDGKGATTPNLITGVVSGRPWMTTSVSPSAIAFWQFGFIGVFLVAFVQSFFISILEKFIFRKDRPELFMFFYFLLLPLGLFLHTWFMIIQWVIPIVCLFIIYKAIFYKKSIY